MRIEEISDWTLTFSPDGKHLAFKGVRLGKYGTWVDGNLAPSDVVMLKKGSGDSIRFSPDSQHIAFTVVSTEGLHWVVGGKAGPAADLALGQFDFSADSKHFAYTLPMAKAKKIGVVVDHKLRAEYDVVPSGPVFCADGTLEYLAVRDKALYRCRVTGY